MDNVMVPGDYVEALQYFWRYAWENGYVGTMRDDAKTDGLDAQKLDEVITLLRKMDKQSSEPPF